MFHQAGEMSSPLPDVGNQKGTEAYNNGTRPEPVYWLFAIESKESREIPDLVYSLGSACVMIAGLISNTISLFFLGRDRRRYPQSRVNLIYGHLLTADFICLLGFLPLEIFWSQTRESLWVCKISKCLGFTVFYSGCLFLIVLAVDRYIAIFQPLKHLTNRYRQALSISIWSVWTLSVTVGLWQGMAHHVGPAHTVANYNLCGAKETVASSIFTPLTVLLCTLPLTVTVIINIAISIKLLQREKARRIVGCPACRLQGGECQNHINIAAIPRRERPDLPELMKMKSVRMTVLVAFCFTLSQLPNVVVWIIAWLNPGKAEFLNPVLVEVCKVIMYLYICIVPIMHGSLIQRSKYFTAIKLSFSKNSDYIQQQLQLQQQQNSQAV